MEACPPRWGIIRSFDLGVGGEVALERFVFEEGFVGLDRFVHGDVVSLVLLGSCGLALRCASG